MKFLKFVMFNEYQERARIWVRDSEHLDGR
jgi:hypothetical protein